MPRSGRSPRTAVGAALPLLAALVAAEAAVLVLRPRPRPAAPTAVGLHRYFSPAQVRRARDYSRPQLALGLGALAVQGAVLAFLVVRPPRALRRRPRRALPAGAVTGAGLAVALALVPLPLGAVAEARSRAHGLSTRSWAGWAADQGRTIAVDAVLGAAAGGLALGAMRRWPRGWWVVGSGGVVAASAALLFAGPVILDPIFNRYRALAPGPLRSDVLDLARRAGVRVGGVYTVDASRRTTAVNAYVTGLGATRRVVLYDNLIDRFTRPEVRLVVAHELGHVRHRDVLRGLLFLALVAPPGLLAVQRLSWSLSRARATPAALPAVLLAAAVVAAPVGVVGNGLSRAVEARADAFSLGLTHEPGPFIAFERRAVLANLSDPDPPGWLTFLLGTHPPPLERIGAAVAYERRR